MQSLDQAVQNVIQFKGGSRICGRRVLYKCVCACIHTSNILESTPTFHSHTHFYMQHVHARFHFGRHYVTIEAVEE